MNLKPMMVAAALACSAGAAQAEEFSKDDVARYQAQYMEVVKEGEKLFHGGLGNENTVSCDECHPNGTNTHPETYPKFQKQLGKVVAMWEMINWCIMNPLEAQALEADDPKMTALQAYILWERRGVPLAPGKH